MRQVQVDRHSVGGANADAGGSLDVAKGRVAMVVEVMARAQVAVVEVRSRPRYQWIEMSASRYQGAGTMICAVLWSGEGELRSDPGVPGRSSLGGALMNSRAGGE